MADGHAPAGWCATARGWGTALAAATLLVLVAVAVVRVLVAGAFVSVMALVRGSWQLVRR